MFKKNLMLYACTIFKNSTFYPMFKNYPTTLFFFQIQSLKTTCTILILKVSHLLHIHNKGEKEFKFQIYLFYGERINNS